MARVGWSLAESQSVLPAGEATRLWVGAVILALFAHYMWAAWLTPKGHSMGSRFLPPSHLNWQSPSRAGEVDAHGFNLAQGVWSPALFALPFSRGFSQPMLDLAFDLRPPLQVPAASALYFARPPDQAGNSGALAQETDITAGWPLRGPPVTARKVFERSAQPGAWVIKTDCLDGLESCIPQAAPLPADLEKGTDQAWELVAFVNVDASGAVRHVLCENASAEAETKDRLVRALYGWRFPPADVERTGRIIIRGVAGSAPENKPGSP